MAWIWESDARARARGEASARRRGAAILLAEWMQRQSREPGADVYLAHNVVDRELLLGAALLLEDQGCRVFVDAGVSRHPLYPFGSPEEARGLRARLTEASAFVFADSTRTPAPAWVAWALGFKDGQDGRAAVFPLLPDAAPIYHPEGCLAAYPVVRGAVTKGEPDLWVHESELRSVTFRGWLGGKAPYYRYGSEPA